MNYPSFVAFVLSCVKLAGTTEVPVGSCTCAVFAKSVSSEPLIEHALPFEVSCDAEGSAKCLQLCTAIAAAAKEGAPAFICERINRHVENLKVSVYTRDCSEGDWKFTGLEVTEGISCHEGKQTFYPTPPSE